MVVIIAMSVPLPSSACARALVPNVLFEIFAMEIFDRELSQSEREDLDFVWRFDLSRSLVRETLGASEARDGDQGLKILLQLQNIETDPNKIQTWTSSSQRAFRVRVLRIANTLKRYSSLISNARGARFFHGSSSASLVSLMADNGVPTCLLPSGHMLNQGQVPFLLVRWFKE
jgi:hypothetical protein